MLTGTVVLWDIDGTLLHSHGFGVRAFVDAIDRVTGNVLPAATAKVTAAGLGHHLRMELGGYGSDDHELRNALRAQSSTP